MIDGGGDVAERALRGAARVVKMLSVESRWTKSWAARRGDDRPVSATNRGAAKWCLNGAGRRVLGDDAEALDLLRKHTARALPARHRHRPTSTFNDQASHAEVLAVARRAAETLDAEARKFRKRAGEPAAKKTAGPGDRR